MTTNGAPTGERLDAIFKVVVDEAHANADFANRLRDALNGPSSVPSQKPKVDKSKESNAPDIHAINILRKHGEQMLRGRLSNLRTKADLAQVAKRSGLRLTGKAAKKSATRPDLIDGIVEAAIQYDRQRESVDG